MESEYTERILRPTVYLPAAIAQQTLGNVGEIGDRGATNERVIAIPVARESERKRTV